MTEQIEKNPVFSKRIKNGKISDVFIGFNENGDFTAWIYVTFGTFAQGFGGLAFSIKDPKSSQVLYNSTAGVFIASVLQLVGVQHLNQLIGESVRVYHDNKKIYFLGNYLQDAWLSVDTLTIHHRESPEGITETIKPDGTKHYGLEADTGKIGADVGELGKN